MSRLRSTLQIILPPEMAAAITVEEPSRSKANQYLRRFRVSGKTRRRRPIYTVRRPLNRARSHAVHFVG
jgi:hypothetical protein